MNHMKFETPDLTAQNIEKLAALFPGCVTEGPDGRGGLKKAVNFDLLKQLLSDAVLEGDEAYEFTWVGKKAAIVEANKPIRKTLRPCPEESKNWDTTENLYIEGDNLEVLKLLQEAYLGKVKMIYIDPPYNTGHDFIYNDRFEMDKQEYDQQIGLFDEEGNKNFVENPESNPRFHSDWCSMMYPRLMLARNLLSDDGVIFISIDDTEIENLRKICNEVLGEKNFVACLVFDKNRKNDAKYFSVGHEYMLVYFKSMSRMNELGVLLRAPKEGIDEVRVEFERLRKLYNDDWEKVNDGLKALYTSWPDGDERKLLARFSRVDAKGPYRDDGNISWPGGGGPRYTVLHPVTGKPCKIPSRGWVYPTPSRMQEEIKNGRVVFGKDETTTPRIRTNLFEQDKKVMRSVIFSYAQTATQEFNRMFDNVRIFENPKSIADIKKVLEYYTSDDKDAIILDFFSGSATTAHAVIQLNAEDRGHRKFIMVQLPEPCDKKSEAYKAGYKNICEIGKERIRRAGEKIELGRQESIETIRHEWDQTTYYVEHQEECDKLGGLPEEYYEKKFPAVDTGFRVLKLDSTNMEDVYYSAQEYSQQMLQDMVSNIKSDRTDLDLLFGCLLDWGLPLSMPYHSEQMEGCTVHTYNDGDLIACFDENVPESVIREIARRSPLRAVFRDSSFATSPEKINVGEIFKLLAPDTRVKVI